MIIIITIFNLYRQSPNTYAFYFSGAGVGRGTAIIPEHLIKYFEMNNGLLTSKKKTNGKYQFFRQYAIFESFKNMHGLSSFDYGCCYSYDTYSYMNSIFFHYKPLPTYILFDYFGYLASLIIMLIQCILIMLHVFIAVCFCRIMLICVN